MWPWIRRKLGTLRRLVATRPAEDASAAEPVRWRWSGAGHAADDSVLLVELAPGASWDLGAARRWQAGQSYRPLWLRRLNRQAESSELLDPSGELAPLDALPATRWRAFVRTLFAGAETAIESAVLVVASEQVDRVDLDLEPAAADGETAGSVSVYRSDRFVFDFVREELRPLAPGALIKRLPLRSASPPGSAAPGGRAGWRGPYTSDRQLPEPLEVAVLDAATLRRPGPPASAPRILVLAPFLARGGAEHTLYETTRWLAVRGDFEFVFATLAQHRRELGDRRNDFRTVSPLIYSLGDLLHPGAMYGALLSLVDTLGIRLLYNANGSTLFYEFARRLRRDRPGLPIVDHLYDHRVGYIDWYTADLVSTVDWCVAENHPIAETLVAGHGWRRERAPVLWPCGRPPSAFSVGAERAAIRGRLRRELGVEDERLLVLTAARAHPQKRPFDWLRLAERLRDRPFDFLWVGGGDLEQELDRALAGATTRHARRLPFRDDIPELLLAADVGCLVSEFEGLPVFLLESLQAGRPFVATDVGDIARVLRPSGAGRLAGQPGDLDGLERALLELLDPAARRAAGAAASQAGEQFGVEACADRYAALFRTAMAG